MNPLPKDWKTGFFRAFKSKKCWGVICPAGEFIEFNFNSSEEQNALQANFLARCGNLGLLAESGRDPMLCSHCKGTGKSWEMAGHNVTDCVEVACPTCNGKGTLGSSE